MDFKSDLVVDANYAKSDEIWALFWEVMNYLNGNLKTTDDDCDFGDARDISPTTKNLKEHKILFGPGGHNHAWVGLEGSRIHSDGIKKRHFDLNSVNLLWWDYLDTKAPWDGELHFVLIPGTVTVTTDSNGDGEATLQVDPSTATSQLDIRQNWYDNSGSVSWDEWGRSVLGFIVSPEYDFSSRQNASYYVRAYGGSYKIGVINGEYSADHIFYFYLILRYVGDYTP